ncbi:MAG: type II secretion system protein, partial [Candidatus Buchananbacteria bacterium]|nr:type II secretion system protein [Candidatus Buchananbacteria bacterium]
MKKGFTLIELLVVVAVITALTAVVLPSFRSGDNQLALQRSASKLAQDLRRVQGMAVSAQE